MNTTIKPEIYRNATFGVNGQTMPPELQSIQMEQAVIAALMTLVDSFDHVEGVLVSESFYSVHHRAIFTAISDLHKENMAHDVIMVEDWLKRNDLFDEAGGSKYLLDLMRESPVSLFNLPAWVSRVKDLHLRRKAHEALQSAQRIVQFDHEISASDAIEKAVQAVSSSTDTGTKADTFVTAQQAVVSTIEQVVGLTMKGTPTGFVELDNLIGGLAPGNLIIVAAGSSAGKSLFASNLACNLMDETGKAVVFYSMEMPAEQITLRNLCALSGVSISTMTSNQFTQDQWARFQHWADIWANKPFLIDSRGGQTIESIKIKSRRIHREKGGLACIVVDYIQLMTAEDASGMRSQEVDKITRGLKALALELQVPIIAISQFKRTDKKRNTVADLRESGSIEQDADVILMIHQHDNGLAEIEVGKQRQGPRNVSAWLAFNGAMGRFENRVAPGFMEGE